MTSFTDAFQTLGTGLHDSLSAVGTNIPVYAAAFLILLLGVIVGFVAKWIVVLILGSIDLDNPAKKVGWTQVFRGGYDAVDLVGEFVRWFFILVFFVKAMDAVDVPFVGNLVHGMLNYVPHAFAAAVVLGVGGVFAGLAGRLVLVVSRLLSFGYGSLLNFVVQASLWTVWVLLALDVLELPRAYISFLFYPVVGLLAVAGGLAFGLGLRENAKGWWTKRQDLFKSSK